MSRFFLILLLTLVSFFTAPHWTTAQERDSTSDQSIRVISADGRTATSTCIGIPDAPVCAIDTFWACTVWDDQELCTQAGRRVSRQNPDFIVYSVEYFLVDAEVVHESDTPPELIGVRWYKPGMVDVTLKLRYLLSGNSVDPEEGWHTYSFMLEQVDGNWSVVSYALWGFEDFVE